MNFVNSDNFLIPYAVSCVMEAQKFYNSDITLEVSAKRLQSDLR